jgi:WD40 repeat protein
VPSVFISYSRHDQDFVQRLHDALAARSYEVWVDWHDIPPSAEWFEEIRAGILGADGVVYVISPDSVVSEVCTRELEHAVEQHKRIVPVVHREPDVDPVPPAAAALNWVWLRDGDEFTAGIEVLLRALETDLEHVRTHTRLGVAAGRWESSGRERSQLLRGAELTAAEAWLVAVGDKQPHPTRLQREYLLESRRAATRRQRVIIGGVSLALVVAVALGAIALVQRSSAIHERDLATARFLDAAAQSNDTQDPELSVLLATQAARVVPGSSTEEALRESLAASHLSARFTFTDPVGAPDAVWSPDGTRLLIASPGMSTKIYRPATATAPVSLPAAPGTMGQTVWDARGDRVLIGGAHPAVYDATTGRLIARIPGTAARVALSSDGTRAATTDLDSVGHVFAVATGRLLASFHPVYRGGVTCFAWAPDDSAIAQCDAQSTAISTAPGSLDIWDPRTGSLLHSDHSRHFIDSVAFSPDGRRYVYTTTNTSASPTAAGLARASGAAGTFVYDTRTGDEVIAFPGSASAATFSPVGGELAYVTIGDDLGHVYSFASGLNQPLVGATAVINSVSFNRAGTYVVTGSDDGIARVYNASTGGALEQLADGDTGAVLSAGFGLDGTAIATSSADRAARLWSSPDARPARQIALTGGLAPAAGAGFSRGGERIVEAGLAGQGQTSEGEILDAQDLRRLAGFTAAPGQRFAAAGLSRDGRVVAALAFRSSGGTLVPDLAETFDARSGRPLATVRPTAPDAAPINGTLDAAGDRLVTVEANGNAEQWDPRTGRRLALLPGRGPAVLAAYSPDGSLLAVVHQPTVPERLTFKNESELAPITIALWDPRTGKLLRQITGPSPTPLVPGVKLFAPLAIAFSANSKVIALAGADTHVWVYDSRTGTPVGPLLQVPDGQFAVSLAFSPNDRMLAAGTAAGAFIWSLPSTSLLPEFQHADPSQFSIENGGTVFVGFTGDSRILATVGDNALEAWDIADHLQLLKAFAARGGLNLAGTEAVATAGDRLSVYPCELCGGLPQLMAVAKRQVTRGLTAEEKATYLNPG